MFNKGAGKKWRGEMEDAFQQRREEASWNRAEQRRVIASNVQGYREAGIHPLFALGGSASNAPMGSAIPPPPSDRTGGADIGGGIADAGAAVANYMQNRSAAQTAQTQDERDYQLRKSESDARVLLMQSEKRKNDLATILASQSALKRTSQAGNARQDQQKVPGSLKTPYGNVPTPRGEPANVFEDWYGDILGNVFGALNIVDSADQWRLQQTKKHYPKLGKFQKGFSRELEKRSKQPKPWENYLR